MGKDPAFLFYSNDFYSGVATLNWEDRGKYITLLCLMHQQGRMKEETIRFLVGSVSDNLKSKFTIDKDGLWFNEKLEEETEKRRKFTESRRNNGNMGGRPKSKNKPIGKPTKNHMDNHMEDRNRNENKDVNRNEKAKVKLDFSGVVFPFNSDQFMNAWDLWVKYKKEQFNFNYKPIGLQGALKDLAELSGNNETKAVELIQYAISKGWQGIYSKSNGNGKQGQSYEELTRDALKHSFGNR